MNLTPELKNHYTNFKELIHKRLEEFSKVSKDIYFYELCYCICTPQSKAENAMKVQNTLMKIDFFNTDFNESEISEILLKPDNYIRFHNEKAKRLIKLKRDWSIISAIISAGIPNIEKRDWLAKGIDGIGYKEAGHFMRNIGFKNIAILDRHILRMLVVCGVFSEIPNISTKEKYNFVETEFQNFANKIEISMDELDLLFWSYVNGEILK